MVAGDDQGLEVIGFARGGPSNHQVVGMERAMEELTRVMNDALHAAQRGMDQIRGVVVGLAGADFPEDVARVDSLLRDFYASVPFRVVNDAEIALRAGSDARSAIVAVAGTGGNVFGINNDGLTRHVGGLGYEWGDFGSGIDLAREVLHVAFRSAEFRGPKTAMEETILSVLGLPDYESLSRALYFKEIPETHFLVLAPLCFQAALGGDDVACRLLTQMGRAIGESVIGCAKLLSLTDLPCDVVMAGSLWLGQAPQMKDAFLDSVRKSLPQASARMTELRPVAGAVLMAVENSGVARSCELRDSLIKDARLKGIE